MRLETQAILEDARCAAEFVRKISSETSRVEFLQDEIVQAAVERKFEIIGEALNRLKKSDPDVAGEIPDIARIVAFRNVLIHAYDVVDATVVWDIMQQPLTQLAECIDRLLS